MTLAEDIADDMATMDGVELVKLIIQNRPDDSGSVEGINAIQGPLDKRDVSLGTIGLEPSDTVFNLQANTMQNVKPQQRDVIVQDDGTRWSILSVSRRTLGTRWRCVCRLQAS